MRPYLISVLVGFLLAVTAVSAQYQVLGASSEQIGGLRRTETTVQVGPNPFDQFKITRWVDKDLPAGSLKASLLLLPPAGFSFTFYEQRDGDGGPGTSFAGFFAARGYDVYGYSPRWDGIPAGLCESGLADCSFMAGWGLQSTVDDVAFVRSVIEAERPGSVVVIGGFSLGAIVTVAVLNAAGDDYDGALLWEGVLATADAEAIAHNQPYCAAFEAQLAAGLVYDDLTFNLLKQVGQSCRLVPSGLTPIPLYPPVLTNHQVLVAALSVPTPGLWVSQPVPTYVLATGDVVTDSLTYAAEDRVLESAQRLYSYFPTALYRDISCSLAGVEDEHVDNLAAFGGAVLAIGVSNGWGPNLDDQLGMMGSLDTTLRMKNGFGHVDLFWHPLHRRFLERPILSWLRERWP